MKDINLQSGVFTLHDLPENTTKVMFLYDERGWAMRCYNSDGDKITTMVINERMGDSGSVGTLVPNEQL